MSGTSRVNRAVLTDANGRYEISELPAGRYTVTTNKTNYVRASYGQQRALGPGKPIDLANAQILARIDFALQRTGVITGRVLDELGDPATDVEVAPMRYVMGNGERRLQRTGPPGATNDLGEYRIYGLAPGQYVISATLRNSTFGDSNDRTAYAPTFYPGTGNVADAQRLMLAPGQTITDINLTLQPVESVRVSGVALDVQGRPMAGAYITIIRRVGVTALGINGAQVKPDGRFSIGGVPPGEYMLRVSGPGQPDEYATLDLTVAGSDINDVQLLVVKASTVRGRVVFEAGGAKPPAASSLRVMASPPNPMSARPGSAVPKDDLTFEMKTAAGRAMIRVGVFGTGDWRVKRVLAPGGLDVTDSGLDVPANATVEDVVVEMTSHHSEVSGSVHDAAGERVRDCVVVVFAQDPQRWTPMTRYYGTSRPDLNGVFHMRVPPGDYYAVAFEDPDNSGQFNDPDVLRQLRDRAIVFSIADAKTRTLELALSVPPIY